MSTSMKAIRDIIVQRKIKSVVRFLNMRGHRVYRVPGWGIRIS